METSELLDRLAATLRHDIGPAVGEEYPRTQAFMASVILERVSRLVRLGPAHAAAEQADLAELVPALEPVVAGAPSEVTAPARALTEAPTVDGLGPLIEGLYLWAAADPAEGGAARDRALALIRPVLRRDIDRRMEVAR
jgi:hypothetical protein